jgi:hypothetical protein
MNQVKLRRLTLHRTMHLENYFRTDQPWLSKALPNLTTLVVWRDDAIHLVRGRPITSLCLLGLYDDLPGELFLSTKPLKVLHLSIETTIEDRSVLRALPEFVPALEVLDLGVMVSGDSLVGNFFPIFLNEFLTAKIPGRSAVG